MEKYEVLLNEIKEYLNKDEINYNTNNEIISAYDLYNIMNEELEGLRNITINSKINKKLRALSLLNLFSEQDFNSYTEGNDKTCTIFFQKSHSFEDFCNYLKVNKDNGINELYFSEDKNHCNKIFYNFVKNNYNLVLETLQTLENYVELLGNLNFNVFDYKETQIDDSLFKVKLKINCTGVVEYEISILDNHELFEEYNKKWYKREGVYEFANKNAELVLKRIAISPYELEEPFKNLYDKHKEKENVKILRMKK